MVNNINSESSSVNVGRWNIDIDNKINDKVYKVATVAEFESALAADTACRNTAQVFSDALAENFLSFLRIPKQKAVSLK